MTNSPVEGGSASQAILHVVATPIGTLADFSPRAREILANVDFIACEDTRHTARLLNAYGLRAPLESLHGHNEYARAAALVERLLNGTRRQAALVTDAGTPGVSDPGSHFVGIAHDAGVRVLSAPGPSSLAAALGACGFEARRAVFSTFFPRDNKSRLEEIALWRAAAPCVGICFESPQRLVATLAWLASELPAEARLCVSREISKRFEEHVRGSAVHVAGVFAAREADGEVRGECVVCVAFGAKDSLAAHGLRLGEDGVIAPEATLEDLAMAAEQDVARTKVTLKAAAKARAEGTRHAAKDIYGAALVLRSASEQAREEEED